MGLTLEIDKKPLQPGYVQMSLVIQWEFPIIIKKTAIASTPDQRCIASLKRHVKIYIEHSI